MKQVQHGGGQSDSCKFQNQSMAELEVRALSCDFSSCYLKSRVMWFLFFILRDKFGTHSLSAIPQVKYRFKLVQFEIGIYLCVFLLLITGFSSARAFTLELLQY